MTFARGAWIARAPSIAGSRGRGKTRDESLTNLAESLRDTLGPQVTFVLEGNFEPVVGVTEVADMLGWDRRKVAVYATRGHLPPPIAELAGGRVWRRADIETYKASRKK